MKLYCCPPTNPRQNEKSSAPVTPTPNAAESDVQMQQPIQNILSVMSTRGREKMSLIDTIQSQAKPSLKTGERLDLSQMETVYFGTGSFIICARFPHVPGGMTE